MKGLGWLVGGGLVLWFLSKRSVTADRSSMASDESLLAAAAAADEAALPAWPPQNLGALARARPDLIQPINAAISQLAAKLPPAPAAAPAPGLAPLVRTGLVGASIGPHLGRY